MILLLILPALVHGQLRRCEFAGYERGKLVLMVYDTHRAPSNSFTSEDDAIYGDAGGTTPVDANGDTSGENEGEELHQSDAEAEEEEEDSEDVSCSVHSPCLS